MSTDVAVAVLDDFGVDWARALRADHVGGRPERVDHVRGAVDVPGVGRVGQEVREQRVARDLAAAHVVLEADAGPGHLEERQVDALAGAEEVQRVVAGGDHGRGAARRPDGRPVGQRDA